MPASPQENRRPRVLVCDPIDPAGIALLEQGAEVDLRPGLSPEELVAIVPDYEALVTRSATKVTAHVLAHGINLKVVGRAGSGLDNIDVPAALERGIEIVNSPGANSVAVAEHTLGLLISLARRLPAADLSLKEGRWDKKQLMGTGLAGKTLGIIGFGHIGREVAVRAQAFGMKLLVNQRRPTPELDITGDIQRVDLVELLRQSDFVTIHVPLNEETRHLIGADELALMKSSAYLINTARGGIVEEAALLDALNEGQIAGAALDVFVEEPVVDNVLVRHPRIIATPHIAASTEDAQKAAAITVAEKILELLRGVEVGTILPLRVVALDRVDQHEDVDPRRVDRLATRLAADGVLRSPPVVIEAAGRYVVLDGASRTAAFRQLAIPHIIVQLVSQDSGLDLQAWRHVIRRIEPVQLAELIDALPAISLQPVPPDQAAEVMVEYGGLCILSLVSGETYVVYTAPGASRFEALNQLTETYFQAAHVDRTLDDDLIRLQHEYEDMAALVVFPVFTVEQVMQATQVGDRRFPAGITRFLIPGRVLNLNADISVLKSNHSLPEKNRWLHGLLQERQHAGAIRYYGEPVYLLDD